MTDLHTYSAVPVQPEQRYLSSFVKAVIRASRLPENLRRDLPTAQTWNSNGLFKM